MNRMNTPRTRAEFERNFHLLHRQIEDGKFHVAQGLRRSIEGIIRVRFLPNGRIDFLSVDEAARLEANMMAQMSEESFRELEEHQGPMDAATGTEDDDEPPFDSK